MAKTKLQFPIILKHLDLRNLELYEAVRQNPEERKELDRALAYVLPLWFAGTFNGEDQISLMMDFNRHVNIGWWDLEGHPELRAKVLGAIGLGRTVKHDFHYRETRRNGILTEFLVQSYPDIRTDEVQLWCSTNSEAILIQMCSDWGVQEKERDQIIDAYRKVVS